MEVNLDPQKTKDFSTVDQLKAINKKFKMLNTISQKISEIKSLPELLHDIMDGSKKLLFAEASSLLLYNQEENNLQFFVVTGDKGEMLKKFTMELGEGIAGWVAENRKSALIENCYEDSRFNPEYDKKSTFKTHTMICVPLIRKDVLYGVIQVINKNDGTSFTQTDLDLFEILAAQCAISIENNQLLQSKIEAEAFRLELEKARTIQQNLLPKTLPEYHDLDIDAVCIPAKHVGGDYYNILKVNEKQSLFFIADVSGKGIPAALIVSTIDAVLQSYLNINKTQFNLLDLVNTMNQVLITSTTMTQFATAWFGLFNHDTNELLSINAGHNPPYFFQHQKPVFSIEKGGIFLGIMETQYEHEILQLGPNDLILFFTDGVTEAWNHKEEDYGEDRLIGLVQSHQSAISQNILSSIQQDVEKYIAGLPLNDDFTCCVIKKN